MHEFFESIKREFWPKSEEGLQDVSAKKEDIEVKSLTEKPSDTDAIRCDYCNDIIKTRAYHLHGKVICSPCLNNRYDAYTSKTFKRITNKSLEEVKNKI